MSGNVIPYELCPAVSFITVQYELFLAASFCVTLQYELCLAVSFITICPVITDTTRCSSYCTVTQKDAARNSSYCTFLVLSFVTMQYELFLVMLFVTM